MLRHSLGSTKRLLTHPYNDLTPLSFQANSYLSFKTQFTLPLWLLTQTGLWCSLLQQVSSSITHGVYLSVSFTALPNSEGKVCSPAHITGSSIWQALKCCHCAKRWINGSQWYVLIYTWHLTWALRWWLSHNWETASSPSRFTQHGTAKPAPC